MSSIYLGIPTYDSNLSKETVQSIQTGSKGKHTIIQVVSSSSQLSFNFNLLLSDCLNKRNTTDLDYFLMLHADIGLEEGWIDKLVSLIEEYKGNVISVISPIKDNRGLVSCGIWNKEEGKVNRFTLRELYDSSELKDCITFGNDELGLNDNKRCLVVNTGVMLVKLKEDKGNYVEWIERTHFEMNDNILTSVKDGKKVFTPATLSEDWHFSLQATDLRQRVLATRDIKLEHFGRVSFKNTHSWGDWDSDRGTL